MCRTLTESRSGSYAGRIAPPGMPKTVSTSIASRESTRPRAGHLDRGPGARACCATCAGLGLPGPPEAPEPLGVAAALLAIGTTGFAGLVSLTAVHRSLGFAALLAYRPSVHKKCPSPAGDDGGSASA